ncbi:MAG: CDP-alcohol phosphatidyltransferase family protein [SAR324 cluster bacterium]|nr:CDP-alcohol phosphatidyltransferase family protein [SAR324 cluster bacterium]
MRNSPGRHIYRNIANATSILGVLPLGLLFLEGGYQFLFPIIIFNNVMDDLDGILAGALNIRSRFGANLDNVCDAIAHVTLALVAGAHFGGWVLFASLFAATAVILRATSRLNPGQAAAGGTPTNELMRHLLLLLLLAQAWEFEPSATLIALFSLHAVSMFMPFHFPVLIRGLARNAIMIALVNVALVLAWLVPAVLPFLAAIFIGTYLFSFVLGGGRWIWSR